MAKTLSDMFAGMAEYFLANPLLADEIGDRFWEVGDEHMIATLETLQSEPAASHGKFVTWKDSGETVGRLKGGRESKLRFARVDISCYGRFQPDARSLRELVLAVVGMGFRGTWGITPIRNAHWDYSAQDIEFDETVKMCRADVALVVPYLNN